MRRNVAVAAMALAVSLVMALAWPRATNAHCDTMDGPVAMAARAALESGDLKPVLAWVKEPAEAELEDVFRKALAVRDRGPEARELADLYFMETVVRLHRAGEGAPYTGLKPAGTGVNAAVRAADEGLAAGSADELVRLISREVEAGLRARFAEAVEAKRHADESVDAGRKYVEAYVGFVHYAERLYEDATGPVMHEPQPSEAAPEHHHEP